MKLKLDIFRFCKYAFLYISVFVLYGFTLSWMKLSFNIDSSNHGDEMLFYDLVLPFLISIVFFYLFSRKIKTNRLMHGFLLVAFVSSISLIFSILLIRSFSWLVFLYSLASTSSSMLIGVAISTRVNREKEEAVDDFK
ncbi:hypothetical protein [Pleionea litopenaei]|uniref:Uncharacterized protein n=1 Tax=Pleionea litopenaei TaxID=3070815 RepID=A0AA51RSC1_9GAMM|nr:hypothetical protein [Pleionea sp. HL-JVS1]WMS86700.1 hypothetical protein Q9312_15880 [Pleionea sp. HL-JVS1]